MDIWVVTVSGSLYRISDEKIKGTPVIQKIIPHKKGPWENGPLFTGGTHVGIGTFGWVHLFEKGTKESADDVNSGEFGGHTSQVVAIFLTRKKAMRCWGCYGQKYNWDKRWVESTRKALRAIGENHPVFVLSRYSLREAGVIKQTRQLWA